MEVEQVLIVEYYKTHVHPMYESLGNLIKLL